jgi:thiosulfate/3-mercaptopyruvate sulfurtransferase
MAQTWTREDVLVSTDWLEEHLNDRNLRILDCRYYFDSRDAAEEYRKAHIPGAVHFDWSHELNDPENSVAFSMAGPEKVEATMSRAGIGNDTRIIAYDDEGGHFGSRVWLVLARFGKESQLRILDGGWTKWVAENRPTSSEIPEVKPATFTIDRSAERPEIVATADDVLAAMKDGKTKILDVRRMSEFTGEEVRAKRGGRIPDADYLFWQDNLDWNGDRSFVSEAKVKEQREAVGIDDDTPVITYCQGGVRAAHSAISLLTSGVKNVRVYDGSWGEWGNRDDLPLEKGPAKEK